MGNKEEILDQFIRSMHNTKEMIENEDEVVSLNEIRIIDFKSDFYGKAGLMEEVLPTQLMQKVNNNERISLVQKISPSDLDKSHMVTGLKWKYEICVYYQGSKVGRLSFYSHYIEFFGEDDIDEAASELFIEHDNIENVGDIFNADNLRKLKDDARGDMNLVYIQRAHVDRAVRGNGFLELMLNYLTYITPYSAYIFQARYTKDKNENRDATWKERKQKQLRYKYERYFVAKGFDPCWGEEDVFLCPSQSDISYI